VDENVAYASGSVQGPGGIIKTTDKGISWTSVFSDTTLARTLVDCYFWTADSGIAVGGYLGYAVVIKTTNGGTYWETVHRTNRPGSEWGWKIHFINRQVGYVSIKRFANPTFILKTINGGINWQEISLPSNIVNLEGIGFLNETTGWVGGWGTFILPTYETTNGGSNWHLAGWGYNVNRFRFLSDTIAYAVGDRVFKYSNETVGINLISSEIPSSFQLHQNYPNPFNPVTFINYELPITNYVSLKVFDILGNEVAILVNEKQNAGSYSVDFDGTNFSSGIYFYELNVDDPSTSSGQVFSEVKRMVLLK